MGKHGRNNHSILSALEVTNAKLHEDVRRDQEIRMQELGDELIVKLTELITADLRGSIASADEVKATFNELTTLYREQCETLQGMGAAIDNAQNVKHEVQRLANELTSEITTRALKDA